MGCMQGKAQRRIVEARVLAATKSFGLKTTQRVKKFDRQMGSLFTVVEASVSHEGSLN